MLSFVDKCIYSHLLTLSSISHQFEYNVSLIIDSSIKSIIVFQKVFLSFYPLTGQSINIYLYVYFSLQEKNANGNNLFVFCRCQFYYVESRLARNNIGLKRGTKRRRRRRRRKIDDINDAAVNFSFG